MLLAKSSYYQQKYQHDAVDARLALAGLYIVALFPLVHIFARTGSEILSGLLITLFIFRSHRARDWQWLKRPPVAIALALWLYTFLIVTPLAVDPHASLGRVIWLRYVPFFAAIAYWLSDYRDEMKKVAMFVAFLVLLVCLDGVYQMFYHVDVFGNAYLGERLTGPFKKLVFGIYVAKISVPVIGLLLFYAVSAHKKWLSNLLILLLLFFYFMVIASNERTAPIVMTAGLFAVIGYLFYYLKHARLILGIVAALVIAISTAAYTQHPFLKRRVELSMEMARHFSESPYMQVWKASVLMFRDFPETGVGMNNFRIVCPTYEAKQQLIFCGEYSHNIYLEWLSETGAPGFIGFMLLIAAFFSEGFRPITGASRSAHVLRAFAIATLLLTFFPFGAHKSFFSNWPAFMTWYSLAWAMALVQYPKASEKP